MICRISSYCGGTFDVLETIEEWGVGRRCPLRWLLLEAAMYRVVRLNIGRKSCPSDSIGLSCFFFSFSLFSGSTCRCQFWAINFVNGTGIV